MCVTHRSEPSAQRYEIGVVLQVEQLHQLNWGLTGGETPRLRQNLRSEREERDRGRVVRQEHRSGTGRPAAFMVKQSEKSSHGTSPHHLFNCGWILTCCLY